MVTAAQWHREFIAHPAAERWALRETHVMGVRWLPAAKSGTAAWQRTGRDRGRGSRRGSGIASTLLSMVLEPCLRTGRRRLPPTSGFRRCGLIDCSANAGGGAWSLTFVAKAASR